MDAISYKLPPIHVKNTYFLKNDSIYIPDYIIKMVITSLVIFETCAIVLSIDRAIYPC